MAAFNCATAPIPFIMGITLAMEEQNADSQDFDTSAISTRSEEHTSELQSP